MKMTLLAHKHRRRTDDENAIDIIMLALSALILMIALFFVVVDAISFYQDCPGTACMIATPGDR